MGACFSAARNGNNQIVDLQDDLNRLERRQSYHMDQAEQCREAAKIAIAGGNTLRGRTEMRRSVRHRNWAEQFDTMRKNINCGIIIDNTEKSRREAENYSKLLARTFPGLPDKRNKGQ